MFSEQQKMVQNGRPIRKKTIPTKFTELEEKKRKEVPIPEIPIKNGKTVEMCSRLGDSLKDHPNNWPETAKFDTILSNVIGKALTIPVKEAISMGLEKQNQICCSCTVDCITNEECPCLQMAQKLNEALESSIMKTNAPLDLDASGYNGEYWEKPGFVCGPKCACITCTLKALDDIDMQHQDKFEILRTDEKGFCLYSKKPIEKGAPVISFNGEITGYHWVRKNPNVEQYSMQIISKDDPIGKIFENFDSLNKKYVRKLKEAYKSQVFINPLEKGNSARFLNHSCEPNLILTRVFEGGLSPADMRIVLVSARRIEAGEELLFNYGPTYVKEHLKNSCLCTKCQKKKNESRISKRPRNQMEEKEEGEPLTKKSKVLNQINNNK